ncbi:cytochrome c oxidase, subunit VA/VI [Geranomyces variabilis]|nr:cytochrome c oxidase, subunit VA/VI [Geranomyces variabilis]KAJ3143564.1 Cytochrome c oxidase subunit 6 [Geranomyces variabilis]
MTRLFRLAPVAARAVAFSPIARPTALRAMSTATAATSSSGPSGHSSLDPTISAYPTAHDLDPNEKNDYEKYVGFWRKHFQTLEDDFELERGLNHIFATDWVPSVEVIGDALRAARAQNSFATAVRTLEALQSKAHNDKQYQQYVKELQPLLTELGIVEKKDLGSFEFVREKRWWME